MRAEQEIVDLLPEQQQAARNDHFWNAVQKGEEGTEQGAEYGADQGDEIGKECEQSHE